jgi:acyl carrier protein
VNTDDLLEMLTEVLARIAPEADVTAIDPTEDLRDELDIDSMDELNMITRVSERLGIDIPERDYPQMRSLDGAIAYLAVRTGAPTG